MANCFLSHATVDKAAAVALKRLLEARRHRVFLDTDHDDGIQPGEVWEARLQRELRMASIFIFLNSDAAQRSKWCHYEVLRAKELGKRILHVDVAAGTAPFALIGSYQGIRGTSLAANGQRVIEALDNWNAPTWDPARPPYPGLFAFDKDDEAVFFGRDDDVLQLLSLVALDQPPGGRTILIMGPSGVGKSSLVRAGLVPRVARHRGWRVVGPFSPGRDPHRDLHQYLDLAADSGGQGSLVDRARRITHGLQRPGRLMLVLDQAEELLQPDTEPASRERLVTELQAAASDTSPVTAVISFREDRLAELKAILPAFFENGLTPTQVVNRLPRSRLAELVEGPARVAGLDLAPGLVGRLTEEAAGDDDDKLHALPLIAFTLGEMYHRVTASGRLELNLRDYEDVGRFGGAVRQAAEDLERSLTAGELTALDTMLPKLVTVAENGAVGARTVRLNDLDPAEVGVSQKMSDKRLLNISQAQADTHAAARLVHERLVTDWPRIKSIVNSRGDDLRLESRLRRQADEFANKQRDLLSADATTEASAWLRRQSGGTPDLAAVREYVKTSQSAHRRRRRRRRGALGIVVLSAVAAVWFGISSRSAAQLARANAAADRAVAYLADDRYVEAAWSAYQSLNVRRTDEAEDALRRALGPLRNVRQLTPASDLFAVAFSLDGSAVATGDFDGNAIIWDVAGGPASKRLNARAGPVSAVAFNPDGSRLASAAGNDGMVVLWNVSTGEPSASLKAGSIMKLLTFSADGTKLAGAGFDQTVVWDVATGHAFIRLNVETTGVNGVAFSPDGTKLATASDEGTVIVWDIATGKPGSPLEAHKGAAIGVAFSSDGTKVATAGSDRTVIVWDVATGKPGPPLNAHNRPVIAVAFSPEGSELTTISDDGATIVWDVATGEHRAPLNARAGKLRRVAFSPDRTKLATVSAGGAILWDVGSGNPRAARETLSAHTSPVTAVAFSADGTRIATASDDWTTIVWDVASGNPGTPLNARAGPVVAVAFSPDETRLATAHEDGTAIVWDLATDQPGPPLTVATSKGIRAEETEVAFSPDGAELAIANVDDETLIVWNIATGQSRLTALSRGFGFVRAISFNLDGTQLAAVVDIPEGEAAVVWDVTTGQERSTTTLNGDVWAVALSPDGTELVTHMSNGEAIVWDIATGRRRASMGMGEIGQEMRFSPDGTTLATAGDEARLWDIATGQRRTTLTAHDGNLSALMFSPDGTRLATGSDDETAIVWTAVDLLSLDELNALAGQIFD